MSYTADNGSFFGYTAGSKKVFELQPVDNKEVVSINKETKEVAGTESKEINVEKLDVAVMAFPREDQEREFLVRDLGTNEEQIIDAEDEEIAVCVDDCLANGFFDIQGDQANFIENPTQNQCRQYCDTLIDEEVWDCALWGFIGDGDVADCEIWRCTNGGQVRYEDPYGCYGN